MFSDVIIVDDESSVQKNTGTRHAGDCPAMPIIGAVFPFRPRRTSCSRSGVVDDYDDAYSVSTTSDIDDSGPPPFEGIPAPAHITSPTSTLLTASENEAGAAFDSDNNEWLPFGSYLWLLRQDICIVADFVLKMLVTEGADFERCPDPLQLALGTTRRRRGNRNGTKFQRFTLRFRMASTKTCTCALLGSPGPTSSETTTATDTHCRPELLVQENHVRRTRNGSASPKKEVQRERMLLPVLTFRGQLGYTAIFHLPPKFRKRKKRSFAALRCDFLASGLLF